MVNEKETGLSFDQIIRNIPDSGKMTELMAKAD
jgi:hypothetical protein